MNTEVKHAQLDKITNSVWTKLLSYGAMLITPFLIYGMYDLGRIQLDTLTTAIIEINARVDELRRSDVDQNQATQNINLRMELGRKARDEAQNAINARLGELSTSITTLNVQLNALNISMTALATTINERVPKKFN